MAIPPNSPQSSGPVFESFKPHPLDLPENTLFSLTCDKVNKVWDGAKHRIASIFTSRSAARIDSAIQQPAGSITTSSLKSEPSVAPLDKDGDEGEEPIEDSSASDPVESHSIDPANRAEIGGVLMEFTVKIDGKETPLSPALLAQLQPIFDELAKTPEGQTKLTTGFTCKIRIGDLQNITFYQDGIEILKGATKDLFKKKPNLFEHMQRFKNLYDEKELDLGYASDVGEKGAVVTAPEDFIKPAKPDGNCLLHAAIYHIKKKGHQDLKPEALRQAIADKAQENQIKFIAQDINEALDFAKKNGLQNTDPFRQLFKEGIEEETGKAMSDSACNAQLLVNTYKAYILDNTTAPTSLGAYAIHYLNETYFEGKLLVVQREGENFIPMAVDTEIPNIDLTSDDKLSIPVIIYNGRDHYDAIDSSDPSFWEAYKPRPQS